MTVRNINLYFVGTAGSGKSSMTYAFHQWMSLKGLDTVTVNLDPGAEDLGYVPDVDIREWIDLHEVMKEHGLGPNGAQIACADMLAFKAQELADILERFETDYILIDTPGQLELFSFRKSSNIMVESLGADRSVLAFTMDPLVAKTPEGLISQMLLRATVQFRFMVPVISVLTKVDLLEEEDIERIRTWSTDAVSLNSALLDNAAVSSTQMNLEFLTALETVGAMSELIAVSSEKMTGFEDLYNMIQQLYAGGEDLTSD